MVAGFCVPCSLPGPVTEGDCAPEAQSRRPHTDHPGVAATLPWLSPRHEYGQATADAPVLPTLVTLSGAFVTNEKLEKSATTRWTFQKPKPGVLVLL